MNANKTSKCNRLSKKDRVAIYVRNHNLFFSEPPTKDEIDRAVNTRKKIRVNPKQEPEMSKEEFCATNKRNHILLFGETPNEEDLNKEWEVYKFQLQYNAIRGRTKKQTEDMKAAFCLAPEQQLVARYALERLAAWK